MPDGARDVPSAACGSALRVGGFVPFTTTDYPGALAAVVFCQGCPWRCGYCHNPHLIPAHGDDEREFARIVDWLKTRAGLLDAVVFSGGEPTAQAGLVDAIAIIRAPGFKIGLHTGGAYPRRLAQVLPLVDWVGFDVKAPFAEYHAITGVRGTGFAALASLDVVIASGVAHEVRTTVHPSLTPPDALDRIARELGARDIRKWVLQPFRTTGCTDTALISTAPDGAAFAPALLSRLRSRVRVVEVRSP